MTSAGSPEDGRPATPASAAPRAIPARPTPVTPIDGSITPLIRLVTLAGRIFARALTRVRVEGELDAIPREGPLIIAANHASNLDAVVIGSWLIGKLGRRFQWLGKKELFDWPIVGWVASRGGVHPVDRSTADVEAFRLAMRILEEGQILFVFPEGTRSRDGALQTARDGVALLAMRSGAPIVPVGVAGSSAVWPRSRRIPKPGGRVTVRVGRPFRIADLVPPDTDRRAAKGLATDVIMRHIAELLPPAQQGAYAASTAAGVDGPAAPEE